MHYLRVFRAPRTGPLLAVVLLCSLVDAPRFAAVVLTAVVFEMAEDVVAAIDGIVVLTEFPLFAAVPLLTSIDVDAVWFFCASGIWGLPKFGFGSLIFTCSLKFMQNSPTLWISPFLPEYSVRQCLHIAAYPFVNRTISPGTSKPPGSSHTDTLMHAVGSPTLNVRTTRFSFVTVGVPTSKMMNTTLIFFKLGRMSLMGMQSLYKLVGLEVQFHISRRIKRKTCDELTQTLSLLCVHVNNWAAAVNKRELDVKWNFHSNHPCQTRSNAESMDLSHFVSKFNC